MVKMSEWQQKDFLRKYAKKYNNVLLVYREKEDSWWGDRCYFEDSKYDQEKCYTHRCIFRNEVVIEFDDPQNKKNVAATAVVKKRLKKDRVRFLEFDSGNKSRHLHVLIDPGSVRDITTLKKAFIRKYTRELEVKPDMRLAAGGHLIRCEGGFHEKNGRQKVLVDSTKMWYEQNKLSEDVWEEYYRAQAERLKRNMTIDLKSLEECTCVQLFNDSVKMRGLGDGKERALFILIHVLKNKYEKQDLIEYLYDWAKYAGGYRYSHDYITRKVTYHYNREYHLHNIILELMEELGQDTSKCPVHGDKKECETNGE